jgi:hypothetical protein
VLERKFRDVKNLVPFTENNRRSIISVMQQRAKLIHSAINFADTRVHPQPHPRQDDSGAIDVTDVSSPSSRTDSPVLVCQQYRIPGWNFSQQTRDPVVEADAEETIADSESVLTVSSTGQDESVEPPDAAISPETLTDRTRRRPYRTFSGEASVDSSIRL